MIDQVPDRTSPTEFRYERREIWSIIFNWLTLFCTKAHKSNSSCLDLSQFGQTRFMHSLRIICHLSHRLPSQILDGHMSHLELNPVNIYDKLSIQNQNYLSMLVFCWILFRFSLFWYFHQFPLLLCSTILQNKKIPIF